MENLKILQTEKVKSFLTEKGLSPAWLASELGMTKQNLYLLLKKEYFKPDVSQQIIALLGDNFTEEKKVKESTSIFTVEKMLEIMEENRKLWSVIARHGISVNFSMGVSVSGFGRLNHNYFFDKRIQKRTHPTHY